MKIGIRTVFKTENCGSFFQAWALKEQLSSMENEVRFSDYQSNFDNLTKKLSSVFKCCMRFRFKRAWSILKKSSDFKKCQKLLPIEKHPNESDLYFLGSDTLWNFNDRFFDMNAPFFTGADLDKPCFTYSISVASTSKADILKRTDIIRNIQKIQKVAVRDSHTESVLKECYLAENTVRTVDPTLLFDKQTYVERFGTKKISNRKTLVLYYFGSVSDELWTEIRKFARARELQIVYIGLHEKKFDLSVVASPENFVSAFASADYILTNTFHGCVFSAIFNKQFATDGIYKKKIEGLLGEFGLLDRGFSAPENLEKVFEAPVDYERVNALIREKRAASVEYLRCCVSEVRDHE